VPDQISSDHSLMPGTRRSNLAFLASGLVMFALVTVLAGLMLANQYAADKSRAEQSAHDAARLVATQYTAILDVSSQVLRRIEAAITSSDSAFGGSVVLSISDAVRDLPAGYQYSVYNDTGDLRLTSFPKPVPINVADREYFIKARGGQELGISPMITERLSGQKVFIVARRIDKAGEFLGVATIAIPVDGLNELSATLRLSEGSTISLVRTDGMLIARSPAVEPTDLSDSELFRQIERQPDGTYQSTSAVDGVRRVVGYWQLPDAPAIGVAGIAQRTALGEFVAVAVTLGQLAVPILIGAGWMFFQLLRIARQDERHQHQLEAALDHQNFLMREIHHRVKNNLQTVMSLIRLAPIEPDTRKGILGRIAAMVTVHEKMYKTDQFEVVDLQPYLTDLVHNIINEYGAVADLALDIDPIRLSGDRAMQLGLLTNELVSNAFKHGLAPGGKGRLAVSFKRESPGMVRLVVQDDGPGYDMATVSANMGSQLVQAFAEQLGGTVTVNREGGCVVSVDLPADPA